MGSGERVSTVSEAIKEQGGDKEGMKQERQGKLVAAPVVRCVQLCRLLIPKLR
jgi:hypothetical protein